MSTNLETMDINSENTCVKRRVGYEMFTSSSQVVLFGTLMRFVVIASRLRVRVYDLV